MSSLDQAPARKIRESGGPTTLVVGSVSDGFLLKRNGSGVDGLDPANLPGSLMLIEKKTVPSDTDTLSFTGIDGDADGSYLLVFQLIKGAAGFITYVIRPNGLTTNQKSYYNTLGVSTSTTTDMQIASSGGSIGDKVRGDCFIDALTGAFRTGRGEDNQYSAGTIYKTIRTQIWDDDSTNITSIDIVADTAAGIKAGSVFTLYRLSKSTGAGIGGGSGGGPGSDTTAFHENGDAFGEDCSIGLSDNHALTVKVNDHDIMKFEESGTMSYTGGRVLIGDDFTPLYANGDIVSIRKSLADQLLVSLRNSYGLGDGETSPASATIAVANDLGGATPHTTTLEIFNSTWTPGQDGVNPDESAVIAFGSVALRLLTQNDAPVLVSSNEKEIARFYEDVGSQAHEFVVEGAASRFAVIQAKTIGTAHTGYGARFMATNAEGKTLYISQPEDGVSTSWNDKADFATLSTDVGYGIRATVNHDNDSGWELAADGKLTVFAELGLNGSSPVAKGTITGSRGGNAALASLLTYLASRGDIVDSTS